MPGTRGGWPEGWTVQHSYTGSLVEIRQPHAVIYSKEAEFERVLHVSWQTRQESPVE